MKLHWFMHEKPLFESEGDIPLVGQSIYFQDYSSVPPIAKKRLRVIRVDRSITSTVKDMRVLNLVAKGPSERYYEAIEVIEKELEGGKVTGVALPFFKVSLDVAEIHLAAHILTVKPDGV